MNYKVQYCKAWVGTWKFSASNDVEAWKTVKENIKEHTQTVVVDIESIHEIDDYGNCIRQLPSYEDCLIIVDAALMLYKVNFNDNSTELFKAKDDVNAWYKARIIKKEYAEDNNLVNKDIKINWIEEIDRSSEKTIRKLDNETKCKKAREESGNTTERITSEKIEKAIYKAYFSDGECSGPFVAEVKENDVEALELAKFKLNQHIEYNNLDIKKIKITKIEELNENMNFQINIDRVQNNKTLKKPKPERKNRFIENVG